MRRMPSDVPRATSVCPTLESMAHTRGTAADGAVPARAPVRAAVAVIIVSDRSSRGDRVDTSGPRAVELLNEHGYAVSLTVIPDGIESVSTAIRAAIDSGVRVVITSGGTGIGPRDLTPEGTRSLLERELPGISEELRRQGASNTPFAVVSRGLAGIADNCLVVNLPGAVKAVSEGLAVLLPLIDHILSQLDGGDH